MTSADLTDPRPRPDDESVPPAATLPPDPITAAPSPLLPAGLTAHASPNERDALPDPDTEDLDDWLRAISGGTVLGTTGHGPRFGTTSRRRRALVSTIADAALPRGGRAILAMLTTGWILTLAAFWWWWTNPDHRVSEVSFALNSILILYATGLPTYFVIAANRMRRLSAAVRVPDLRVAMVVTKAPSEPWPVVRTTLEAMLAQHYPYSYDVWLADEHPDEETLHWCEERGVGVSTRYGDERYQRPEWPRRRRCKEGNLAYFYDHFGYAAYDVVAQLDADHVPGPGYLSAMVRPFADPAVGYVGAPSICDANAAASWAVRGRLYEESLFHGAQQMGALRQGTPSCIGSHYAVRTAAIRQIGGIGPELAEDFSTSYLLNVAGWRGAFAIDADAHGDGPRTFAAMITQEFQWSRSLATLLFRVYPLTAWRLPLAQAVEFGFRGGFDVLISAIAVAGVALFAISCITGVPWMNVNILVFFGFGALLSSWLIGMKALMRSRGLCRPQRVPLVSWEGVLYLFTRWPYIVMGVGAAVADLVAPRPVQFRVTPKGDGGPEQLRIGSVLPFVVVSLLLTACAWFGLDRPAVIGYVGLALLTAAANLVIVVIVAILHAHDVHRSAALTREQSFGLIRGPVLTALVAALPVVGVSHLYRTRLAEVLLP